MGHYLKNKELIKALCDASSDEERKAIATEFVEENKPLLNIIADGSLYAKNKASSFQEYADTVSIVVVACLEMLASPADAERLLATGGFWTAVQNRAKEHFHVEKGTGVPYSTFKRLARNDSLDFQTFDVSLDENRKPEGNKHVFAGPIKSVEEMFIDQEVQKDLEQALDSLTDIERAALECKKYHDFSARNISRRTYSRIRSRAKAKVRAQLMYTPEEYYEAMGY